MMMMIQEEDTSLLGYVSIANFLFDDFVTTCGVTCTLIRVCMRDLVQESFHVTT